MKDPNGLYYYPNPAQTDTRVYVREGEHGNIQFRLWHSTRTEIWERHGWLDLAVIEAAATMYKSGNAAQDPMRLYDAAVAKALIKEDKK